MGLNVLVTLNKYQGILIQILVTNRLSSFDKDIDLGVIFKRETHSHPSAPLGVNLPFSTLVTSYQINDLVTS